MLVDEARRLSNVHLLLEISIQECQFHIHVMNRPVQVHSDGEHEPNGLEVCHWCEHLLNVHPLALDISFGHQTRLVVDDGASLVTLQFIDPLEADGVVTGGELTEAPCPIGDDVIHLLLHRVLPL